ncbi:aldehyde dehydrogenase family protein [Nonomuraea sp. NPDC052129]|uniref:aldehyde dehydrogenase family protein n=1 Tax=Nonomuraea sp. NPDC052129 TaxID=3154651 RepID=UPI00344411A4
MTTTTLPATGVLRRRALDILARLDVTLEEGDDLHARTPITGETLLGLTAATPADADEAIEAAHEAFLAWRTVPAPRRGEVVRRLAELLREHTLSAPCSETLPGPAGLRRACPWPGHAP